MIGYNIRSSLKRYWQYIEDGTSFIVNRDHLRSNILRKYIFILMGRYATVLGTETNDISYLMYTKDRGIAPSLFLSGDFEIDKLKVAGDLIRSLTSYRLEENIFIDIGANIGTTTVPALKVHHVSKVLAFEPAPKNIKLLRCNSIMNDIEDRVDIFSIALSDQDGIMELELAEENWGDHRLVVTKADGTFRERDRRKISVEVATFDSIMANLQISLEDVGLIWIDTQGHEGRVLSGASLLLESQVPVLTEYWPYGLKRSNCLDLFNLLVSKHYKTIIDIGAPGQVRYPAEEVGRLIGEYPGVSYTDLLLLS